MWRGPEADLTGFTRAQDLTSKMTSVPYYDPNNAFQTGDPTVAAMGLDPSVFAQAMYRGPWDGKPIGANQIVSNGQLFTVQTQAEANANMRSANKFDIGNLGVMAAMAGVGAFGSGLIGSGASLGDPAFASGLAGGAAPSGYAAPAYGELGSGLSNIGNPAATNFSTLGAESGVQSAAGTSFGGSAATAAGLGGGMSGITGLPTLPAPSPASSPQPTPAPNPAAPASDAPVANGAAPTASASESAGLGTAGATQAAAGATAAPGIMDWIKQNAQALGLSATALGMLATKFGGGSTPASSTGTAQDLTNAAIAQAKASTPNIVGPYGNRTTSWKQDAQGNWIPTVTSTDNGMIPKPPVNPGQTGLDVMMKRLQPIQQHETEALQTQLRNQGLVPGGEAYGYASDTLNRAHNDAQQQAVLNSIGLDTAANQNAFTQFNSAVGPSSGTAPAPLFNATQAGTNYNLGLAGLNTSNQNSLLTGLGSLGAGIAMAPKGSIFNP
mgnify:CR=1 FL=1